jgi:hypothetical protein
VQSETAVLIRGVPHITDAREGRSDIANCISLQLANRYVFVGQIFQNWLASSATRVRMTRARRAGWSILRNVSVGS